jgi:hypothetical protein
MLSVPVHWTKGQLLDLRRFGDGSFLAVALGEEPKPDQSNVMRFDSTFEAQNWISAWYTRESVGGIHG